jgi:intracellular multiplication protein IcmQ
VVDLVKSAKHSDLLKQQLIDCVQEEKADFMEIANAFYQQGYRTRKDYIVLTKAIVEAVDHVLVTQDWNESLFLRNALKPLKAIRQQASDLLKEATETAAQQPVTLRDLEKDEILVYISIFQSQGHSLRKWELQLSSLRSHLLGRPVYEKEVDVVKVIRQKLIQTSEAYIVVAVKQADIQDFAHQAKRVDRYDNALMTLQASAVQVENIFEFVHQDKRYFFSQGKLIEQV